MTVIFALFIIIIIILMLSRRQIHKLSAHHTSIRIIKYIIAAAVGAFGVLSFIFTIGEASGGDIGGLSHVLTLIPAIIIVYLLLRK